MSRNNYDISQKLMAAYFAVNDAVLFLDTHPEDAAALEYLEEQRKLAERFAEEYAEEYGPLTVNDASTDGYWDWVASPWPWELEMEV